MMIFYGYFNILPPGVLSDEFSLIVFREESGFVRYTSLFTIDGILNGRFDIAWDAFKHLILPIFAEVIVICAQLMRVLRSGMLEEMSKDYVITARAKGADEKTVILKHAKRNAMIPVITLSGQLVAFLMPGSIAVEIVFNRTGIGWWVANSATQLDTPVLMAISLFMALVFVVTNLIVDILYAYIDPRIRLS
jgi:peptide/nickel transport system permease protein